MKTRFFILSLCCLFISSSIFAWNMQGDWKNLEPYQRTLSKQQIEQRLQTLIKPSADAQHYVARYFRVSDDRVTVLNEREEAEFTFFYGDKKAPAALTRLDKSQGALGNLVIALDGHDKFFPDFALEVVKEMTPLLEQQGATVEQTQKTALLEVLEEANTLEPDIAIAIRFDVDHENTLQKTVSFCPGCTGMNELESPRQRYRLMHSLVTNKLYTSAQLALHLAQGLSVASATALASCQEGDYEGAVCAVQAVPELADTCRALGIATSNTVPGIAARNLFWNGIFGPAVVWTFPRHNVVKHLGADAIASQYVQAIVNFVARQ